MKPYARESGRTYVPKWTVQDVPAKQWCPGGSGRQFRRSDGSLTRDKTWGFNSRPTAKQARRQANRAMNKRARKVLKRQLGELRDE